MRVTSIFVAVWMLVSLSLLRADDEKAKPPEAPAVSSSGPLAPKYRDWLDLVAYIASKEEKRVFSSLTSDRDRDAFIQIFWTQRDPTPGTPQNEKRDELESRFAYANQNLNRGSARPGWMTDMGRFYMILGKPNSIERYEDKAGLYPVQVWWYFGDKSLGLPTYFNVTFFKPHGSGEWKLYNPSADGPASLLIGSSVLNNSDYQSLLSQINELAPQLLGPARSMLPNDQVSSSLMSPSPRDNLILASIFESPFRNVSATYATNFLKYKGFVNVEQTTNFIDNTHLVALTRDPRFPYDLVTVSVRPRRISLGYNESESKYYFNLNLNVSLRLGEKIVYQYAKNFEFHIREEEVATLQASGVVVHDTFPVVPGRYQLTVYAENVVGREFTYFDKVLVVPGGNAVPFLGTPVMGFRKEPTGDSTFASYKLVDSRLCVDADSTFGMTEKPVALVGAYNLSDSLWESGTVEMTLKGLNERTPFSLTQTLRLRDYPRNRDVGALVEVSPAPLNPDYYELILTLRDAKGTPLDTKSSTFTISPLAKVNHPMEAYKRAPVELPNYFDRALAAQYEGSGNLPMAEAAYQQCLKNNPAALEVWAAFLTLENRLHKYDRVLAEAERLKASEPLRLDYLLLRGMAFYGQEKFAQARDELLAANRIYNSDTRVLNLLGFTWQKLGNRDEALRAFSASLGLNREQPLIARAVEALRTPDGAGPR